MHYITRAYSTGVLLQGTAANRVITANTESLLRTPYVRTAVFIGIGPWVGEQVSKCFVRMDTAGCDGCCSVMFARLQSVLRRLVGVGLGQASAA